MLSSTMNSPIKPRTTPDGKFYGRLRRVKDTFLGGSEHRVIAEHVSLPFDKNRSGNVLTLLDVGASDCRHTSKIMAACRNTAPFRLVTVDPDDAALVATPPDVVRHRHFSGRYEKAIQDGVDWDADVVLFSHSLYYFAHPIEILAATATAAWKPLRIVVSHWGEACALRALVGEVAGGEPPLAAEEIASQARHIGRVRRSAAWTGVTDFKRWRDDKLVASAAAAVLAPAETVLRATAIQQLLSSRPLVGIRANVVFSIDVKP